MASAQRARGANPFVELGLHLVEISDQQISKAWPSPRWQADPVGFAHMILGVELWEFQRELLEAIRDSRHVAAAGGRKIGKDFAVAVAALWWYASWEKAKVFMLAPSYAQLDGILYLQIRELIEGSGRCLDCKRADPYGPRPCPHSTILTGKVGTQARTGVRASDFRQIFGKTATSPGQLRGFSGSKILALLDEASDIKDSYYAAVAGNLAAEDCHTVLTSNPTKPFGFFYRAFFEEAELYRKIQCSSERSPNVAAGRQVFPGLASRLWLEEREKAWGRGSPLWISDVEGQFPKARAGQPFTPHWLKQLTNADRAESASRAGRLRMGIDVAGAGDDGDEIAFVLLRGDVCLTLFRTRGLEALEGLSTACKLLDEYRTEEDLADDQIPIVTLDADGKIGTEWLLTFMAYRRVSDVHAKAFRVQGFHGGNPPKVGPLAAAYKTNRDLCFAGLIEWCKEGGSLPDDLKLTGDLVAFYWMPVDRGRSTLCPKSELRDILGRSPDSADAFALALWTPGGHLPGTARSGKPPVQTSATRRPMDPYAGRINPYGRLPAAGRSGSLAACAPSPRTVTPSSSPPSCSPVCWAA